MNQNEMKDARFCDWMIVQYCDHLSVRKLCNLSQGLFERLQSLGLNCITGTLFGLERKTQKMWQNAKKKFSFCMTDP